MLSQCVEYSSFSCVIDSAEISEQVRWLIGTMAIGTHCLLASL